MKGYGPIDAMEYPHSSCIRMFMHVPFQKKLKGVDFPIIGAPFDTGSTYRVGARLGPEGVRSAFNLVEVSSSYDNSGATTCLLALQARKKQNR